MTEWWTAVVDSPSAAVFKLVMTEVRNFPEIGEYYVREVVEPGTQLLRSILQRGVDSGEFCPMDTHQSVFSIISPMMFLMMWKHSMGACASSANIMDPQAFIHLHVDLLINGVRAKNLS